MALGTTAAVGGGVAVLSFTGFGGTVMEIVPEAYFRALMDLLPGGRQGHSLDKYRDVRVTDTTWGTHSHKWHCHFDTLLYSTSGYSYKV